MFYLDTTHFKEKKNLLAFSAGVDSSALFFLLLKNNISFDIALVNYVMRESSNKEEAHAHALAKQYKLTCHSIKAPTFTSHFEHNARTFRYAFFDTLILEHGYDTLITAHQLNDQLEWFLMRLAKGAGVCELLGLEPVSQRKNHILLRPLLSYSKEELLSYLKSHDYPYFLDESNSETKYERNLFRKQFSDPLMAQYKEGIKRSFDYLRNDKEKLEKEFENIYSQKELRMVKLHTPAAKVKAADLALKELGYLLSAAQRKEIEKEESLVIGGEWAIETYRDTLYISPYSTVNMPKYFKEKCRILKIPAKIRAYCFDKTIDITELP